MAIRDILTASSSDVHDRPAALKEKAVAVEDFKDPALQRLIDDMIETLLADPICVGLAAPQLEINLQVAVVCPSKRIDDALVIINPSGVEESGQKDIKRESCMSLPGVAGQVERRKKLRVSYFDRHGSSVDQLLEGFVARVAGHEIDHLSGIMYCDRASGPLVDLDFDAVRRKLSNELSQ